MAYIRACVSVVLMAATMNFVAIEPTMAAVRPGHVTQSY
jgi:hypothetical protein